MLKEPAVVRVLRQQRVDVKGDPWRTDGRVKSHVGPEGSQCAVAPLEVQGLCGRLQMGWLTPDGDCSFRLSKPTDLKSNGKLRLIGLDCHLVTDVDNHAMSSLGQNGREAIVGLDPQTAEGGEQEEHEEVVNSLEEHDLPYWNAVDPASADESATGRRTPTPTRAK